jgi:hypothetical protein
MSGARAAKWTLVDLRGSSMRPRSTAAVLVLVASIVGAEGPSVIEIEARLPSLVGRERARALSELAELLHMDDPQRALTYGAQALEAFGREPDPARTGSRSRTWRGPT